MRTDVPSAGEGLAEHKERVRQFLLWLMPRRAAVRRLSIDTGRVRGSSDIHPPLYTRLVSLVTAACCELKQLKVSFLSEPGVDWADAQHVVVAALARPVEDLALSLTIRAAAFPAPLGLVSGTLRALSLHFRGADGGVEPFGIAVPLDF